VHFTAEPIKDDSNSSLTLTYSNQNLDEILKQIQQIHSISIKINSYDIRTNSGIARNPGFSQQIQQLNCFISNLTEMKIMQIPSCRNEEILIQIRPCKLRPTI